MRSEYQTEQEIYKDPFMDERGTEPDRTAVQKGEDGCYRWTYEMELLHNHGFLLFLIRLILIPTAVLFLISLVLSFQIGVSLMGILQAYGILLAVLGVLAVVIFLTHLLMAKLMDNSYCLKYEMNEKEVALVQGSEKSSSVFRRVKTVRIEREEHCIYLNSWFLYNLIYCEEEDFDFVADYIASRCVNARITIH